MRLSRRGNPVISKGVSDFDDFLKHYNKDFKDQECAIHFRWATHGDVCADQAHPYEVTKGTWIMHNGVIEGVPMWDNTKSDTWHFAQMLTEITEKGWMGTEVVDHLLEYAMQGTYSRLVVMNKNGFKIFNETGGVYWNQVWYSNLSAWSPPQALLDFVYPPKKQHPIQSVLRQIDENSATEQQYIDFWTNAISNGMVPIEEAPPEIHAYYDEMAALAETSGDASHIVKLLPPVGQLALISGMASTQVLEETVEQPMPEIPQSLTEWANLTGYQIRRICYDSPDAVSDALFDMLQR